MSQSKEKQSKAKPWERHEVFALCGFVKHNDQRLFGSGGKGCAGVEAMKQKAWQECRDVIVAAGGRPERKWDKCRKKWQDLSAAAKKYHKKRQAYLKGTGGGAFVPPDEKHEWVIDALPATLVDGITPAGATETARSNDVPSTSATVPVLPSGSLQQKNQQTGEGDDASMTDEAMPSSSGAKGNANHIPSSSRRSRKRQMVIDTETEESQEESQEEGKRKRKGKKNKKAKKESDEVSLLSLNKTVADLDEKKVGILEGILQTLQGIHGCLQRLVPAPPTAIDLLNNMQPEQ